MEHLMEDDAGADRFSLDQYVDLIARRDRPAYVDITDAIPAQPPAVLVSRLSGPLISASARLKSVDPTSRCLVFFDFGSFESLATNGAEMTCESLPLRTLLYAVQQGEFLILSGEAYVKNLAHELQVPAGLGLTYACFRDFESLVNSWEFNAGCYFWETEEK